MSKQSGLPGGGATLLEHLLALLRQGGVRSLEQVAGELGTSPALVETMLEDLARRGLLHERPASCCAGACQGCSLAGGCKVGGAGRVWQTG